MSDRRHPRVLGERRARLLLNLYPPMLFNRIRIVEVGPGFRSMRVRVQRSVLTRNLQGTTFGGTIFSAADPWYAVMYWQIFARRGLGIRAWLKSARIDYLRPATTALTLDFALADDEIERAASALQQDGRFTAVYPIEAIDENGTLCARIESETYLRLPRSGQGEVHAF